MAVTQRKNGSWAVYYPLNGKLKWEYFGMGITGEKKAKERNEELKQLGVIGKYTRQKPHVESPLFQTLAHEYTKAKSIELPKVSIDNLMWKLMGVIIPEIGHIHATRLTHDILRRYVKNRLKSPVYKRIKKKSMQRVPVKNSDGTIKTVSKSTIHRELSDIQAILNWSVAEGFILTNPVQNFRKPKRDDEIILPPSPEETTALLKHAAPHLHRALIIAFYTGLRPGAVELLKLTWGNVDLKEKHIHIISAQKGGSRDRLIPLHQGFEKQLIKWAAEDKVAVPLETYIIQWKGKPVGSIKKAFAAAKRRAGITRRLRPYDFRHAFATAMLRQGADLKSTSEMLGHSRTDTTNRIYQHTDIEFHRENIAKLPELILDDPEKKKND
jgi:integrase